jgi:ClpP class serine protease
LSAKHKIPVYIFAEEMAASAGYHIATAGNEVYANEMSLVGSIGVISMSFGVKKLMEQLNVDVRIMNKGNMKTMMSPFQDQLPEHKKHMDEILEHSYEIFKNWVKKSREGKLKDAEHADEIFSGAVFKAHRAVRVLEAAITRLKLDANVSILSNYSA